MYSKEEFEDTKGAIRIRKSKNRQHNDQKEKVQKYKQRSTKHTYKTKDRVELRYSGRVSSSCSTSDIRCVDLDSHPPYEWNSMTFTGIWHLLQVII